MSVNVNMSVPLCRAMLEQSLTDDQMPADLLAAAEAVDTFDKVDVHNVANMEVSTCLWKLLHPKSSLAKHLHALPDIVPDKDVKLPRLCYHGDVILALSGLPKSFQKAC